ASRSPSLQERATPRISAKAKMEAGILILCPPINFRTPCLTRHDVLHLAAFQQSDNPIAAVPYTIFGAPDLVGFDFSAARQHYYGFTTLSGCDSWPTGRDRIPSRACVCSRN